MKIAWYDREGWLRLAWGVWALVMTEIVTFSTLILLILR